MSPATPATVTTADDDPLLAALRERGSRVRRVRYRSNRSVLLSISRDGHTLNSHICFRTAPPEIAGAVARYLTTRRGSAEARRALDRLRSWDGARKGLDAARRERPRQRRVRRDGPETAPLRRLFERLNRERFDGALPTIPLRVSERMTRALGTTRYRPQGEVEEIAIAADLLLSENRAVLEDTMLHEMAHAEAWVRHGHRGHGAPWRRIAERVGCAPRALCRTSVVRR